MTPLFCLYHLAILLCFTCWWVGEKRARVFFFSCSVHFGFFCQLTKLQVEVHISRQVISPHVTVHIGQQTSVEFSLLFIHDTGRNKIIQSLPESIYTSHRTCAQVQLRSIEHVCKYNCVASNMCASTVHVIAPHPTPPPQPHPKKPLRAFAENGNLHGVQAKIPNVQNYTGSPITPPPENRPLEK